MLGYSDLSIFFRGLEGKIEAPAPKVEEAMALKHTASGDAQAAQDEVRTRALPPLRVTRREESARPSRSCPLSRTPPLPDLVSHSLGRRWQDCSSSNHSSAPPSSSPCDGLHRGRTLRARSRAG